MAHEVYLLIVVLFAMLISFFIAYRFFSKKVREGKMDMMDAAKYGLFLALAIFAVLIVYYENTREHKKIDGDDAQWCEEHPNQCDTNIPISPLR